MNYDLLAGYSQDILSLRVRDEGLHKRLRWGRKNKQVD